jgi:hypothetical protein
VDIFVARRTVASRYAGEANERFTTRIVRVFFVDSLVTFHALKTDVPARETIRRFIVVKTDGGFPAIVGVADGAIARQLPSVFVQMAIQTSLPESQKCPAQVNVIAVPRQVLTYKIGFVTVAALEAHVFTL